MKEYRKQAKILQALAHPVRLQIMEFLTDGPAYVCDLIAWTGQRQAYISQNLMLLRQVGLVKFTRDGKNVRYELSRPEIIKKLLNSIS
jgi:ArsR family transcriptional regulator